jgi:uncharacterized protein (DUF1330 family)
MHRLIVINLSDADLMKFEEYEATVLPLVRKYGGRVEARVRALDGSSETHLLFFPGEQALAQYQNDPIRSGAQSLWKQCGARSVVSDVEHVV